MTISVVSISVGELPWDTAQSGAADDDGSDDGGDDSKSFFFAFF